MGAWTIELLRRTDPETRLHVAAYLFWISLVLGVLSTILFAKDPFERIVMAISWLAITLTCADLIVSSDVRAEQDGEGEGG